jgi:flavin reductase (DIM6/NTAB) family NADH-FMN oxidoreductase RutF
MGREKVENFSFITETDRLLRDEGLLLVSEGDDGKPNAMTIGWGLVGTMWSEPFFVVAVRLSRHTHKLIEEAGKFTVCLPSKGMTEALNVCGTKSGRDMDKLKELGLTARKGTAVEAPYIAECPVHYECEVAFKTQVEKGELKEELENRVYASGDYHTLYYGHIKGVYAVEGAKGKLP